MAQIEPHVLPILPLPYGSVLLPGATLRVPVSGRSDVPALLSAVTSHIQQPRLRTSNIRIGCVPLNSRILSSDGRELTEHPEKADQEGRIGEVSELSQLDHRRLFMYGTIAKISGVKGRRADDLSLVVEGLQRLRIDRIVQMRPHFAAEVSLLEDDTISNCSFQLIQCGR